MEASQPAYRAGPVGETVFILFHMAKFQPACRDRNLTRVKNETRAHCLETQRMSNSNIFVSVAGMECSYGEIFIPPTEISPLHQWDLAKRASPPSHMNRNQVLYWN